MSRRLLTLAEAFGAQPQAPINVASADCQSTKADYAFFANPHALPAEILLPHQQRTLERMAAHPLVLAIQDTTFLNYTHHPATNGLGPIGGGQQGLVMHSTLALTPLGLPHGKRSTPPSIVVRIFRQRHRQFVRQYAGLLNLVGS